MTAYATAEEYDLEKLHEGLTNQGLYSAVPVLPRKNSRSTNDGSQGLNKPPFGPGSRLYLTLRDDVFGVI